MAKAISIKPIVRRGNVEMFKLTREEIDLALMYAFESGIADHAGRVVESNSYAQVIQTWKEDYLSTPCDTNLSASDDPVIGSTPRKSKATWLQEKEDEIRKAEAIDKAFEELARPHPSNKVTLDNLSHVVHWVAHGEGKQQRVKRIATAVEVLMHTVLNEAPDCRDRDTALECIRSALMFANSAVRLEEER